MSACDILASGLSWLLFLILLLMLPSSLGESRSMWKVYRTGLFPPLKFKTDHCISFTTEIERRQQIKRREHFLGIQAYWNTEKKMPRIRSIWRWYTLDQAIWLFIQYVMTFDLSVPPQATCSINLASLSQTGTVSNKALTQSVALPGDASSVARVWRSRASPNGRLAVQVQVKYRLICGIYKACISLCCREKKMY